tara:strand:- start:179 stop:421 length:243 start_codon:yes stop_codon:yes gene_type:complete
MIVIVIFVSIQGVKMSILRIDKLGFHKTLKFKNKEDLRKNLADYFSDIDEDIDSNKHNKYDDMNLDELCELGKFEYKNSK